MLVERSPVPRTVSEQSNLARRIDATAWGLLLLMTGILLLEPAVLPEGTWLILAGAILLGASAARYGMHLRVSAFIVALGVVGIGAGALAIAGMKVPLFALFLVLCGGAILLRSWFTHAEG